MQPELAGDELERQWLHRHFAVFEKPPLARDDRIGHALDGGEALLDRAQEPARLLQMACERLVRGVAVLDRLGIRAVQAHARQRRRVDDRDPAVAQLLDDHVGHDIARLLRAEALAGARIERADQRARGMQRRLVAADRVLQPRPFAVGEQRQVAVAHFQGDFAPSGVGGQRLELEAKAFLQRARADARRVEGLHHAQRGEEILRAHVVLRRHQRRELVERHLEVAVVVQAVDDHVGERAVAFAHRRNHQLLAQVLRERRLDFAGAAPILLVALHRRTRGLLLRHHDVVDRRRVAQWRRLRFGVLLEKRIGGERLVHLLGELERRHLEELQRLLDLWREGEVLPQS